MNGRGRLRNALSSVTRSWAVRLRASLQRSLPAYLLALLASLPSPAGAAVDLRLARLGVSRERTRLVLELGSAAYTYRYSAVGDTALVLHLAGAKCAAAFRSPGPDGLFRSLLTRRDGRDDLEVRIMFTAPAAARVFRVGAETGKPPRLVVDLAPRKGVRPVPAPRPPEPEAAKLAGTTSVAEAASRVDGTSAPAPVPSPGTPRAPVPVNSSSGFRHSGPRVVVLDPGHGGGDPGALGKGLREKDISLDVAKRLAAALNKAPGYRAVITRQDDLRVSLLKRMLFAEQQGADLFVSIHVNAAGSSRASGAEVFFLSIGAATDRAAAELARLENEADPDFVVKEDEALQGLPFAVDLRQSDTLLRSSRIAEVVLDALSARGLAESRGVKQAGFAVLKSFQVPSILVEVGFISSQMERKKLKSPDHREKLAEALAAGVRRYFERFAPARPAP